jgi:hypothetical protein
MKPKKANVYGGTGDPNRGTWCTPKDIADRVGSFDLDPFSNPRSHVVAKHCCMLEDGGDGFGDGTVGMFRVGDGFPQRVTADWRVWLQPPYELVAQALDHYGHTQFCALLRFDPRTRWFARLYRMVELVCVLRKCEFEPPPEITEHNANPFPHALYYARATDATDAVIRKTAAAWRVR